jgi:hypothetical protein
VEISDDWEVPVMAAVEQLFEDRLGPDIADDARRYCPVRTGALKASIEHHVDDGSLIVSASGGGEDSDGNLYVSRRAGRSLREGKDPDEWAEGRVATRPVHHVDEAGRTYAVYLELGHRKWHPSTHTAGPGVVAPRPFLRPALFQQRGE